MKKLSEEHRTKIAEGVRRSRQEKYWNSLSEGRLPLGTNPEQVAKDFELLERVKREWGMV